MLAVRQHANIQIQVACCSLFVRCHYKHDASHTSQLTRHLSPLTRHPSHLHLKSLISHLTPLISHLTPHTSYHTPHTSHFTLYTSQLTPHILHLNPCTSHYSLVASLQHEGHQLRRRNDNGDRSAEQVRYHLCVGGLRCGICYLLRVTCDV